MDMDSGINLRLSAAKADDHPFQQSRRQVLDSTREARLACVVARAHAQEADYEAFLVILQYVDGISHKTVFRLVKKH